ncbi:MAG: hypothetical protein IT444_13900 [Phycisphaeraceae bacterium]|nr:hypothetical protein [Phycisphaeraceae bacterium]
MAKNKSAPLHHTPPAAGAFVGVARRDITPPPGIYARMWGAAKHDVSRGTHRPLCVTALAIRADKYSSPILLISADLALLGDLGESADEECLMEPIYRRLGLTRAQIMVNCSHTHASPWAASSRASMPGGQMIAPYLTRLGEALANAAEEALATTVPATFTWATGRCDLATNRDLPDPDKSKRRVVCGFNPDIKADDTVMIGRITRDADDSVLATVVNYACHPTTLAWLNTLISTDYIGAMRDVVESHTGGAPCLFLQGASGELAPAHQYVGDTRVADGHGRRLGFAALSALESMLPPCQRLSYRGVTESGAPLAVWWPEAFEPSRIIEGRHVLIPFPLKKMPAPALLEQQIAQTKDRAMKERLFRKLQIVKSLGKSKTKAQSAWIYRIGQTLIIAHCNEAYSQFQIQLRAAFPDFAVVVMNVTGAEMGYIAPPEFYKLNLYQVWQTPFDRGSYDLLLKTCRDEAARLTRIREQSSRRSRRVEKAKRASAQRGRK